MTMTASCATSQTSPDKKQSVTPVEVCITLLRSLFQAKPGKKLVVADKNAIENRMLGWAAGCKAILDVFRTCNDCGFLVMDLRGPFHCPKCGCKKARDPYLAFGTNLYNKTYAEMWAEYIGGNEEPRQMSKPPVLGAGYCLGGGEMYKNENGDMIRGGLWGYAKNVCGVDMPKELAHKAVDIFRKSYPEVVQFWTDLEEAFKQVLLRGGVIKVGEVSWDKQNREWVKHPTTLGCIITFRRITMEDGKYIIRMELPSGRALHYIGATIESETRTSNKTGRQYTAQTIYYEGVEHSATETASGQRAKKQHKWGKTKTYGGKICLSGTTPVVTQRGLVPLSQITLADRLWDGVQWIEHSGLLDNGITETQTWMGLTGTSDHQILGGSEWHELGQTTNRNGLCSLLTGLGSAARLWYSQNRASLGALECAAIADKYSMSIPEPCVVTKSTPVLLAGAELEGSGALPDSGIMLSSTANFANCGFENYQTFSLDAITPKAKPFITMEEEASGVTNRGEKAEDFGWNTPLPSLGGIIQLSNLIESTTMGIMNREISVSCLEPRIQTIVEQLYTLVGMAKNFPTKSFVDDILRSGARTLSIIISSADAPLNGVSTDTTKQRVYDLQNCGPRNRFTVMTSAGPVIVHNCENAIQAMSRDDLLNSMFEADKLGFHIWGLFHDELGAEEDDTDFGLGLDELNWCMYQIPWWAPGLLLGSEGYTGQIYKKG